MAATLRRGFKAESERRAQDWRHKLGLREFDPLDPRQVAHELGIRVVAISELLEHGLQARSATHLLKTRVECFSAVTLCQGGDRIIVENEAHSEGRRSNSVAHELSHVLLDHEPHPAFAESGTRQWRDELEREADWLAGVLLVPRPAATVVMRRGIELKVAAKEYRVSTQLMQQRINLTGVLQQFRRRRA